MLDLLDTWMLLVTVKFFRTVSTGLLLQLKPSVSRIIFHYPTLSADGHLIEKFEPFYCLNAFCLFYTIPLLDTIDLVSGVGIQLCSYYELVANFYL